VNIFSPFKILLGPLGYTFENQELNSTFVMKGKLIKLKNLLRGPDKRPRRAQFCPRAAWATSGPWATCGPPSALMWPSNIVFRLNIKFFSQNASFHNIDRLNPYLLSKFKSNRSLWYLYCVHRPTLFPMRPARQKELPTSDLEV